MMNHKKTVDIVQNFLEKAQDWVNKTPGAINISIDIGDKNIVLAEKKPGN